MVNSSRNTIKDNCCVLVQPTQLHKQNDTLPKQGLRNRDVDHESYLALLSTVVDHDIGENPTGVHRFHIRGVQEIVGEFVRGKSKTRSLWYHIGITLYSKGQATKVTKKKKRMKIKKMKLKVQNTN